MNSFGSVTLPQFQVLRGLNMIHDHNKAVFEPLLKYRLLTTIVTAAVVAPRAVVSYVTYRSLAVWLADRSRLTGA